MRPQHITAENVRPLADPLLEIGASMRPQHITAENSSEPRVGRSIDRASMRPQHITAENRSTAAPGASAGEGFNEAAAYHCGKHVEAAEGGVDLAASMRPQHITAENPGLARHTTRRRMLQ